MNYPPSFSLQQPAVYNTDSGAEEVTVPAWVTEAYDGEGGTQLPDGGGNSSDKIIFQITSNSNPDLFNRGQPWISYPSHALHFKTNFLHAGSADICMKAIDLNGAGLSSAEQCFTINIRKAGTGYPTLNNPPDFKLRGHTL